jgi:hypothetical protein
VAMTDEEMADFIGIKGHPKAAACIAALAPEKRALFDRMAEVCVEAELYAAGLGPRPVGVLLDFDRPARRKRHPTPTEGDSQ